MGKQVRHEFLYGSLPSGMYGTDQLFRYVIESYRHTIGGETREHESCVACIERIGIRNRIIYCPCAFACICMGYFLEMLAVGLIGADKFIEGVAK